MKTTEEIRFECRNILEDMRKFHAENAHVITLLHIVKELLDRVEELEADVAAWGDVASSPGAVEDMALKINRLEAELEAVKRERDAAIKDLRITFNCCKFCEHDKDGILCKSKPRIDHSCFEWRGVCLENTED